ncbi:MAG: branched-chain amino acid aminotransferase [Bacillota bacterium]
MIVNKTTNPRPRPAAGEKLGFGRIFTDHMVVIDHTEEGGWGEARIEPYGPIMMDPACMVLHYGQAIFEGLKAYRGVDNKIRLFRPQLNIQRMNRSARRLCIPPIEEEKVMEALLEFVRLEADWIPTADQGALYLRPFIFAYDPQLGVHAAKSYKLLIIASPVGAYFANGFNPVKIMVETEYVRACPGGVGEAKVAGNYAASLLAGAIAEEKGYDQVLWLDGVERRYIEEVGAMNIFFKIGDEVVTPALVGSILPGITRFSTIELLKSWGVTVSERRISIEEVAAAADNGTLQEIFGTGTAAVIAPVNEVAWKDKKIVPGNGGVGPLTQKLYDHLTGIQFGRIPDTMNWTVIVA